MTEKTVFAQLFQTIPRYAFNKCVNYHHGNKGVRNLSCSDQYLAIAFAHLSNLKNLREIETKLLTHKSKLFRMGFRGKVSRSTLSDANKKRSFLIYQCFAEHLIKLTKDLYKNELLSQEADSLGQALDSEMIDFILSIFTSRNTTNHLLPQSELSIPRFHIMTPNTVGHIASYLSWDPWKSDSILVTDKPYTQFEYLYNIQKEQASFIIPAMGNLRYSILRINILPEHTRADYSDQVIRVTEWYADKDYPKTIRRISHSKQPKGVALVLLTNNFTHPADAIVNIYERRQEIELFFRWIVRDLKIRSFLGNFSNAVKTQIWIAASTYLLAAIAKKELAISTDVDLPTFYDILRVNLLQSRPIEQIVPTSLKRRL